MAGTEKKVFVREVSKINIKLCLTDTHTNTTTQVVMHGIASCCVEILDTILAWTKAFNINRSKDNYCVEDGD